MCAHGGTTGWACGTVLGVHPGSQQHPTRLWATTLPAEKGDSGAIVYRDGVAVGVLSYQTGRGTEVTGSLITDLGNTLDLIKKNGHSVQLTGE